MLMKNALCFIMGYLAAMQTYVALFLLMHFLQGTWYRCDQCVYQTVVLMFSMTLTFDYVLLVVTQSRHEVCFVMGFVVAMETCVILIFCMIHSIGAINVCTNFEINRYKIFDQEHFDTNQNYVPVQQLWLKQWFS